MAMDLAILRTQHELRAALGPLRPGGIALVPTMGALHDGHLALIAALPAALSTVVVSIFVNPTQFGPQEDFARYPRDLDSDAAMLATTRARMIYAPEPADLYAPGDATRVQVSGLTQAFCGPLRPGHFEGVATIVTKLLCIVQPNLAAFGEKDFQQLAVIRRLATDLCLGVEILGVPTVRDPDGLAKSSRNRYLGSLERTRALSIPRALHAASQAFRAGERRAGALVALATAQLDADHIEYVQCAPMSPLAPYAADASTAATSVLAIACRIGTTRLIDNVQLAL
jgi:pantoate--beta-alanine ligase